MSGVNYALYKHEVCIHNTGKRVKRAVLNSAASEMYLYKIVCVCLLASVAMALAMGKGRKNKKNKPPRGLQCYNCLSHDNPGCWDPEHPDYINTTIPNIDCYIPGMAFSCVVITSESAKLVDSNRAIGPVRARTCVPTKEFPKRAISYELCSKLSNELSASEIFSRVSVVRPRCTICDTHLCAEYN